MEIENAEELNERISKEEKKYVKWQENGKTAGPDKIMYEK